MIVMLSPLQPVLADRQWSWPVDLPLPLLGIFGARILPARDGRGMDPLWPDEIEFENFSESIGIAPYSEVLSYRAVPGGNPGVGFETLFTRFSGAHWMTQKFLDGWACKRCLLGLRATHIFLHGA